MDFMINTEKTLEERFDDLKTIDLYVEIYFEGVRDVLNDIKVGHLIEYYNQTMEKCSQAMIEKKMDDAKYYHCFAHLIELNIKTRSLSELYEK